MNKNRGREDRSGYLEPQKDESDQMLLDLAVPESINASNQHDAKQLVRKESGKNPGDPSVSDEQVVDGEKCSDHDDDVIDFELDDKSQLLIKYNPTFSRQTNAHYKPKAARGNHQVAKGPSQTVQHE